MRPGEIESRKPTIKKCITLLDSEPVSDIDTAVVDSLKGLDPNRPLEKRT